MFQALFSEKIHKSPMEIYPIITSCESPTENISQFIDYWLKPIMKALPSFIKDTTQLINQLNKLTIESNCCVFTLARVTQSETRGLFLITQHYNCIRMRTNTCIHNRLLYNTSL